MKKLLVILILMLFMPLSVKAIDMIYAHQMVMKHYIDAEIEIAGGLRVKEVIVVEGCSTGSFSRNINYRMNEETWDEKTVDFTSFTMYNGFSLQNIRVAVFKAPTVIDIKDLNFDVEYLEDGFTIEDNALGKTITINGILDEGEKCVFYLEYLIGNIVVIHNDVAEINFKMMNLDIGARETKLRVIYPYPLEDRNLYRLWVRGPRRTVLNELVAANGNILGFLAEAKNLDTDITFRLTLPKEHVGIDLFLNKTDVDALSAIIKNESSRTNLINRYDFVRTLFITLSIAFVIVIPILITILIKRKKLKK